MKGKNIDYAQNVFINCPFDANYQDLFNAILFTVTRCGFILRCSKEFGDDSDTIRIENILQLIEESKYAIHDLSRVNINETEPLPRFNMPLELGIFIGCRRFGSKIHQSKKYLILESNKFRFKQFISDLSGQDIQAHEDSVEKVIKCIRNFLTEKTMSIVPSPSIIAKEYEEFLGILPDLCAEKLWIPSELTFSEFSSLVTSWTSTDRNEVH